MIETIESRTQPNLLHSGLPNLAEEGRKKREVPQGSPKKVDPVAKSTTDYPMGRQGVWHSSCQKTLEGSGAKIMIMLADLSRSVKDVGIEDNLRDEMKKYGKIQRTK